MKLIYKLIIIFLGIIAVTALICSTIILCFKSGCYEIPSGIIAIGSAAVGGISGLLVNYNSNPSKLKSIDEIMKESDNLFIEYLKENEDKDKARKLRDERIEKLKKIGESID